MKFMLTCAVRVTGRKEMLKVGIEQQKWVFQCYIKIITEFKLHN